MNLNDELARWGEAPASDDELALVAAVDRAIADYDNGNIVDPKSLLSGAEVLEAVAAVHQLAASLLDHSGLLEAVDETKPYVRPPAPPLPPTPPVLLPDPFPGHYRLLRELGTGGYGKVWLAQHLYLRKSVAIKTLFVKRMRDWDSALEALVNESLILAEINHPNIVKVHDFRPADGKWWLILEYVAGCGLHKRLENGRKLPWQVAARYVADVGEALQAVHARGMIHRDIKPSNILWEPVRDEALLTDFGLAGRLDEGRDGGTSWFMAHEAFEGKASPASDVFSLAATLFCLIAGRPPFPGATSDEIQRMIEDGFPARDPRFAEMPERLEELIRAALAVAPEKRPALPGFVGTLRAALNQLMADALASQHVAGEAAVDLRVLVSRQRADQLTGESLAATHIQNKGATRDLKRVPPPPERVVVRTGERVTIQVISSRAGYLNVFSVGPSGNLHLLYPAGPTPGTTAPQIPAHQPIDILDAQLTPPAGRERLFAVWSSRPLPAAPSELARLTGQPSPQYRSTRDLEGLQGQVEQLRPEEWHCAVLELDHQPA